LRSRSLADYIIDMHEYEVFGSDIRWIKTQAEIDLQKKVADLWAFLRQFDADGDKKK